MGLLDKMKDKAKNSRPSELCIIDAMISYIYQSG